MEDIYVSDEAKVKDLKNIIGEFLYANEKIQGSIVSGMYPSGGYRVYSSNLKKKDGKHFSSFGSAYKVIVTNKRILIVSILGQGINGIRGVEYEDIKKLVMNHMENMSLYLNNGVYYELQIACINEMDKYMKEALDAIDYIIYRIGFNKVYGSVFGKGYYHLGIWLLFIENIAMVTFSILVKIMNGVI